jgi:hypothetical protein
MVKAPFIELITTTDCEHVLVYTIHACRAPRGTPPPPSGNFGEDRTAEEAYLQVEQRRCVRNSFPGGGDMEVGGMDMEEEVKEAYEVVQRIDVLDVGVGMGFHLTKNNLWRLKKL